MIQRRKKNSSKVNLTVSVVFHSVLVLGLFYFAAREGMLGKKLKELTVVLAPKEKKPEPPKEKPPEPKVEPSKEVPPPKAAVPKVETAVARPPMAAPPAAAPPSVSLPAFDFNDGAKDVQTTTDANQIYKGLVEHALRTRWSRPEDIADDEFVAKVEVNVDSGGQLTNWRWLSGSGDKRWDDSVKQALTQTKTMSRPPPKNFPPTFTVCFDVKSEKTESVFQVSSR